MRKLFCVMLVLVLSLGLASVRAEAPEAGMLLGGWTVAEDQTVTDELNSIFCQAMESFQAGTDPVACTPVACLGTQVCRRHELRCPEQSQRSQQRHQMGHRVSVS